MSAKTTRSKSQARAVNRLRAHNQSPEVERRSRSHSSRRSRSRSPVVEHVRDRTARGPSQSSADPPDWAKELLSQQKEYGKELKRLKAELASKPNKAGKHEDTEPEFKFEGNKKQYQLNKKVLEKIKAAKDVGDDDLRNELLEEGEQLLIERNKHICITEKYGWDTVECYTTDPIASDSDDEKNIWKAVKECKLLGKEKMQSKVVEIQTADANAARSGEAGDFEETAVDFIRELKHQTFSTRWRQPKGNFTSDPRFPPTSLAVATLCRRYFAKFDVAYETQGLPCDFFILMWLCNNIFALIRCINYRFIILGVFISGLLNIFKF